MFLRKPMLTTAALVAAGVSIFAARVATAPVPNEFDEETAMTIRVDDENFAVDIVMEVAEAFLGIVVHDPFGDEMFSLSVSEDLRTGLSELSVQAVQVHPPAGFAAFPEGAYTITAIGLTGALTTTYVELSHEMPARPTVLSPVDLALVDTTAFDIAWESSDVVEGYILNVEGEDIYLSLQVPADITSYTVPAEFLQEGQTYDVEVIAVNEAGNSIETEIQVRTAR